MSKNNTSSNRKVVDSALENLKKAEKRSSNNVTLKPEESGKYVDVLDIDINNFDFSCDDINATNMSTGSLNADILAVNPKGSQECEEKQISSHFAQLDNYNFVKLLGSCHKIDKKTFIDSELDKAAVYLSKTKDGSKALQKNLDKFTVEALKLLYSSVSKICNLNIILIN